MAAPLTEIFLIDLPYVACLCVQYENLTRAGSQIGVLADLKRFLGLEPALPQVGGAVGGGGLGLGSTDL